MELHLIRTLQCIPQVACTAILQCLRNGSGSYQYSPYAMPSQNGMAEASGDTSEGEAKQSEVKEKLPIKRSRGSLGSLNMITGKNSGASANGAYSKRQCNLLENLSNLKDTSENGTSANGLRDGSVATPLQPVSQTVPVTDAGVPGPPTNLNIGMDYWGAPASASTLVPGVLAPVSRDGGHSQPWLQDDREVRRKQSNRESARISRLRKQAECDELAQRADVLNGENASLREEINKRRSHL
ncbi:unnamed protein product [Brassica oleracea]